MFNIVLANGEQVAGNPYASLLSSLLMIVLMVVLFYFMLIKPQKKRQKEEEALRNSLMIGDEVLMTSGIIGKVINIKNDEITIETGAARTQIKFTKSAVANIIRKMDGEEPKSSIDEKKAALQKKIDEKKKKEEEKENSKLNLDE